MKTRAEIKEAAKLVMAEQRTTAILLALIPIAISIVGSMLSMIPILGYILSIALSLMTYIISVACTHGYIHIWRGLPASIEASAATVKKTRLESSAVCFSWGCLFASGRCCYMSPA